MSNSAPQLLLEDIIARANKILTYTDGLSFEQLLSDDKAIDAVIRNFEISGEVANRLPEEIRELYLNIDWHRIRGFRNRIVHDYMGIDYKIVWLTKEIFWASMIAEIRNIL